LCQTQTFYIALQPSSFENAQVTPNRKLLDQTGGFGTSSNTSRVWRTDSVAGMPGGTEAVLTPEHLSDRRKDAARRLDTRQEPTPARNFTLYAAQRQ
jgi:hypothetical protein